MVSAVDSSTNARSATELNFLEEILPIQSICGVSQDVFSYLQYFFYTTTFVLTIPWAFSLIPIYLPLTALFFSAILFGYPHSISTTAEQGDNLAIIEERFATYNVLCPQYPATCRELQPRVNRLWANRNQQIFQNIQEARADIIGLQEVTADAFTEMQHAFAPHDLEGHYQGHGTLDEHLLADGVAIFYNTHKFEFIRKGTVVSDLTQRICLFVDMRSLETGEVSRFACFDLDASSRDLEKGYNQLRQILQRIETIENDQAATRFILAGGFNVDLNAPFCNRKRLLQDQGYCCLDTEEPTQTGTLRAGALSRIDSIFMKKANGAALQLAALPLRQPIASDHLLTGCSLSIERDCSA